MSAETPESTWKRILDEKARSLHEQIAAAYLWVQNNAPGDESFFDGMVRDHYNWLRELYEQELPIVKLLDEADLTLELDGPALKVVNPRISVVTRTFNRVQERVSSVAKTISGVPKNRKRFRLPADLELGFTSLARGSGLRFGFTIPQPPPPTESILGINDPTYQAVKQAVYAIRDMSIAVAEVEGDAEIEEHARETLNDPRIRDAALVAVKDLAPTRQGGVSTVRISGRGIEVQHLKAMTLQTRQSLVHLVSAPVRSRESISFSGVVREIDLDSKRFDLRGITDGELNDLRCVYGKNATDDQAKEWLSQNLKVTGRVERDASGKARLLQIKKMEVLNASGSSQTVFDFPEESNP